MTRTELAFPSASPSRFRAAILGLVLLLALLTVGGARAQDRYLGEVFMTAATFCPRDTLEAAGQLVSIASNTALYSLLGTTYGGDGMTTFALPDLRGRVPIGFGQGPGLSDYPQGSSGGTETTTLTQGQMPAHAHAFASDGGAVTGSAALRVASGRGNTDDPEGNVLAMERGANLYSTAAPDASMDPAAIDLQLSGGSGGGTIGASGGSQPHENRMPYLTMRYCVVTLGIFPSRN